MLAPTGRAESSSHFHECSWSIFSSASGLGRIEDGHLQQSGRQFYLLRVRPVQNEFSDITEAVVRVQKLHDNLHGITVINCLVVVLSPTTGDR